MTSFSTPDKMIHYLSKSGYDHMMLMHDLVIQAIQNDAHMASVRDLIQPKSSQSNKQNDVNQFVQLSRSALNCEDNQKLMMRLAWVLPCILFLKCSQKFSLLIQHVV